MGRVIAEGLHNFSTDSKETLMFPHDHITKKDLITYYQKIAPLMLPHIKDRAVLIHRFEKGIDHKGEFHRTLTNLPDWIKTKKVPRKKADGFEEQLVINNLETLLYIIGQHCISPHISLSSIDNWYCPDRMVFIVKGRAGSKFHLIKWVAKRLKHKLESMNAKSFVMSGQPGSLVIMVPLNGTDSFKQVRHCAFAIIQSLAHEHPKYITVERDFGTSDLHASIDIHNNRMGSTIIAPYGVLPFHSAPIATPFEWSELTRITPEKYTLKNIFKRLSQKSDPWVEMNSYALSLNALNW
jgi:bifunctional non-homologous end joining protein LigD